MQLTGDSYTDALNIPLETMERAMDFAKIEADLEQQKAKDAKPQ